jgi:hypothetical protein
VAPVEVVAAPAGVVPVAGVAVAPVAVAPAAGVAAARVVPVAVVPVVGVVAARAESVQHRSGFASWYSPFFSPSISQFPLVAKGPHPDPLRRQPGSLGARLQQRVAVVEMDQCASSQRARSACRLSAVCCS